MPGIVFLRSVGMEWDETITIPNSKKIINSENTNTEYSSMCMRWMMMTNQLNIKHYVITYAYVHQSEEMRHADE
jgi:hypothetical protein